MSTKTMLTLLAIAAAIGLGACSDGSSDSRDPQDPGDDTLLGSLVLNDFGADARRVLPPIYDNLGLKRVDDLWHDGEYALLGKVFGEDEPMSIHRNVQDHEAIMVEVETMLAMISAYEAEYGEIPTGPIPFDNDQYGSGTVALQFVATPPAIPVPAVCQTVFGRTSVTVDYALQVEVAIDGGPTYTSPYLGLSARDDAQVLYYWRVGTDELGEPNGSQLFLAIKDTATGAFEIAGSYFIPDGPGDENECNWVYHLTGNPDDEFTYNMGWYSSSPAFQLFGCVQGSGDKDVEFGLRYHQYTDTTGWDTIDDQFTSEEVFGPVGDDPYAYIDEANRAGSLADYIDASIMFVRDDSPLAEIPNPFLAIFD